MLHIISSYSQTKLDGSVTSWNLWIASVRELRIYRVRLKNTPPLQKSDYFQNNLIFFGELFRGYSRSSLQVVSTQQHF